MKSLLVTAGALLILAASCAPQKTCPTYLKNNKINTTAESKV